MDGVIRTIFFSILALVLIFVFVTVGRGIFGSDDTPVTDEPVLSITDFADQSSRVVMELDGRVVGEEEHRVVRITVTKSKRTVEVLKGYGETVIDRAQYNNTLDAYEVFLRAINHEGFTATQEGRFGDDERGVCADGERTIFEFKNDGEVLLRSWATDCSKKDGTFDGDRNEIEDLFEAQVPDGSKITRKLAFPEKR